MTLVEKLIDSCVCEAVDVAQRKMQAKTIDSWVKSVAKTVDKRDIGVDARHVEYQWSWVFHNKENDYVYLNIDIVEKGGISHFSGVFVSWELVNVTKHNDASGEGLPTAAQLSAAYKKVMEL